MVIVIFSAPPLLGGLATLQRFACNVCSAAPNFRVIARRAPVKNIFGELSSFFTAPRLATGPGNPVYLRPAKRPLRGEGRPARCSRRGRSPDPFRNRGARDAGRRCSGAEPLWSALGIGSRRAPPARQLVLPSLAGDRGSRRRQIRPRRPGGPPNHTRSPRSAPRRPRSQTRRPRRGR